MQQRPIDRSGVLAPQGFVPRWIPLTGSQGRQVDLQNRSGKLQDSTNYPPRVRQSPPQQLQQAHQPAPLRTPWPARHKAWTGQSCPLSAWSWSWVSLARSSATWKRPARPAAGPRANHPRRGAIVKAAGLTGRRGEVRQRYQVEPRRQGAPQQLHRCKARQRGSASLLGPPGRRHPGHARQHVGLRTAQIRHERKEVRGDRRKYLCPQYLPRPPW